MGSAGNQNPWAPYDRYKDCSQGFCSIYCPQWCYIIVPPPPSFGFVDEDDDTNNSSATDFSPLIIAVIGILAGAFILITYYTIISKYCRRRGRNNSSRDLEMDANHPNQASNSESWQGSTSGLDESLIKSITVHKYKSGDGLVEGTDCSVCLSEFEENESLRLLPKCSHAFHVPCIDTWLKSHSSCPLCRSNIAAAPPPAIATLVPPHHQQVLPPVEENGPHHESNVSASEYQHRSNGSVLMVVQDLEEVVSLANDHVVVPKTTSTQCLRERGDLENGENIVEIRQDGIQQFRRSVSLNSSLSQKCCVSIADVLGSHSSEEDDDDDDDDVDEDLENQMEIVQFSMEDGPFNSMESIPFSMENFQFSMEIGSSKGVEEQNCKSNLRSGVFSLVKGPLGLKRSISTGRFSFTRYGKEKNSIIPN